MLHLQPGQTPTPVPAQFSHICKTHGTGMFYILNKFNNYYICNILGKIHVQNVCNDSAFVVSSLPETDYILNEILAV